MIKSLGTVKAFCPDITKHRHIDKLPSMRLSRHSLLRRVIPGILLGIVILFLVAMKSLLLADGTNDGTASPPAPTVVEEDYGKHILEHQDDIMPFIKKHGEVLYRQAEPQLFYIFINALALNLVVGWIFDVVTAYYFSRHFALGHSKLNQAFLFATGHLVLTFITCMLYMMFAFSVGMVMPWYIFLTATLLLVAIFFVVQTIWVSMNYHTLPEVSAQFYLVVFLVHALGLFICYPIIKVHVTSMMEQMVDAIVTPQLNVYIDERKNLLTVAEAARDKVKGQTVDAQNRFDQATSAQADLRKKIEDKKNSDFFVFSRIVHLHAEGDLAASLDQVNAFLVKFPNSSFLDAAKAQLTQVQNEIAAQEEKKKEAEAAIAQAAAQARADLLARAAQGEVTMSEMHKVLQGKTPAEVVDLFGKPSMVSAGQWDYTQLMTINPITNQKYGMSVYFVEGIVQSVDYYYGNQGQGSQ